MYIRIYVYVYTYTCIHVYTYIHIHVCAADLASWAPACYPGNDVISREIRYLKVCQHVLAKNNLQSGRRWSRLRMSICLRAVRTGSGRRERTNSSRIAPRFFMVHTHTHTCSLLRTRMSAGRNAHSHTDAHTETFMIPILSPVIPLATMSPHSTCCAFLFAFAACAKLH